MPSSTEAGRYWRNKAEEVRAQAAQMTDPQARSTMLKIAESYGHLADVAERAVAQTEAAEALIDLPAHRRPS